MGGIVRSIERHFVPFAVLLIAALTAILYQHALSSGFFLDDATSIRSEPLMLQPDILPLYEKFKLRFLGYLSFWANYQIAGEDPASFRLTNLFIHGVNGFLVFILSYRLLCIASGTHKQGTTYQWAALAVAVVFIVHPLQTQAVTYIVQRLASLMTLFYLAALVFWIELLGARSKGQRLAWLCLFVIAAVAAGYTKQNSFTLPAVLVLVELIIFRKLTLKHWSVIFIIVLFGLVSISFLTPEFWATIDRQTRETLDMTRWEYFTHQWVVLWIYLGKVVWPYPQLLDYGIELNSFGLSTIVIAGLGHVLLLFVAGLFSRKIPIVTFGLLFFYVTHSVESGVIPIRDLAFEHRNYLPLFGIFLALGAAFVAAIKQYPSKARSIHWILIAALVFLAQATWFRNQMWVEQEALLKQDVVYNPENVRALHNLALWYQRNERYDDSIDTMKTLLNVNNGQMSLLHATTYVAILIDLKLHRQALNLLDKLLEFDMGPQVRASLLRQYGTVHTARADDKAAAAAFEESIRLAQLDYKSGLSYGYSLIQLGRLAEAETLISQLNSRFGDRTKLRMLDEVLRARALKLNDTEND